MYELKNFIIELFRKSTMKGLKIVAFLFAFYSLIIPSLCFAAVHYVSPTGSASWAQSTNINTPCSVYTAFANARAGDTVYFRGGTYNIIGTSSWYNPDLQPLNSGTSDSPISFEGYQNETVIFVADDSNSPVFGTRQKSYVNFRKFIVDTSRVTGSKLRYAFMFGSDSSSAKSTHIIVENCIVIGHNISITDHHAAIGILQFCDNITVRNCRIYNATGADTSGISLWSATNCLIENNEIYNCYRGIDTVEANSNNIYRYNYIHNITEYGLRIYYQNGGSSGARIYQNIIANTGASGIFFSAGGDHPNCLVYNNTLYKAYNIAPAQCPNMEIFNNIIWNEAPDSEGASYIWHHNSTVDPTIINYNCYWPNLKFGYRIYAGGTYYTSMPWQGYDANSKKQNPSFVDPTSGLVTGFKLNAGSPALTGGRGGSYGTVIGAYITGNEIIGPVTGTTPPPPSPPKNLRISQ
jgi:parallel beta-helix repeat protein